MSQDELNEKIQNAYNKVLGDLANDKNELPTTKEGLFGYALLYSGKLTAYLLEELGLIN